jgi:hypothetical protein
MLVIVSVSCNFATGLVPDSKPSAEATEPTSASSDGFSAEAVEGGVSLKWEPISGAEQYLLEMQIGDEFIPLVVLAADQLSYIDEVPGDAQFTYRLTSLTNAGSGESKSVTVFVPEEQSNPQAVTITFDMAPAALDLNNFDPNNFDPNAFDPNDLDPSMFAPQPLLAESRIGPAGGELSVTGTNGVTYKLTVPPGALDFEVPIRLKPVSSIPDLPLSGGTLGAVLIEPEGIVFDIPAELKMLPPEGSAPPAGPVQVGFAFEGSGQEFHLYPLAQGTGQSSGGAHLASLSAAPLAVPPGSDLADILYGGGYGEGSGTVEDVKKIKLPSKSSNRTAHRAARAQMDKLAPPEVAEPLENLPKLPAEAKAFNKIGQSILDKSGKANDWSKLMDALDDFRIYMETGGDKFNPKLNEKILDKILEKIKALLDKNMSDCLSREEMKAREMGRLLSAPQSGFWQAAADRFKKNYGEKLLKDLFEGLKECTFELDMYSNLTFDAEGQTLFTTAEAKGIPLRVIYSKGEVYLYGDGGMTLKFRVAGSCSFPLKQYDSLDLFVDRLTPIYSNGVISDFDLDLSVAGWKAATGASGQSDDDCPVVVNVGGGGDYWTGLFTTSRAVNHDPLRGWKLSGGPLSKNVPLTATLQALYPSFQPFGLDAKMSEDSKFTLRVIPRKK